MSPKSQVPSPKSKISRPYVLLNLAMTADGKITTANRRVSSFSSDRDRRHMLELRATADAVLSGARTIDLNPVTLGPGAARYRRLRLKRGLTEYNLRVVISGQASLNPRAEIFKQRHSPVIILTARNAPSGRLKRLRAVATEVRSFGTKQLNVKAAVRWLRRKWHVRRLLCEGGGEVDGALFSAGVVDEVHLTICPKIFGGRAAPTICDGVGFASLSKAADFRLESFRRYANETYLVYKRVKPR
jgi:riboflavin-specific deaminase-like protein